jgi:hypothetical protein
MADRRTLGGFFPLEVPDQNPLSPDPSIHHLEGAFRYYNARSAITELVRANRIPRAAAPDYICPVVHRAVESAGASFTVFPAEPGYRFDYDRLSGLVRDGWLLIVPSYFGVFMPDPEALAEIMSKTGCRILLDYAQALYEPCPGKFAAVYSPRKFLGIPDGGFLVCGSGSGLLPPENPVLKVPEAVFGERLACHGIRGEYPDGGALETFRRLEQGMPSGGFRMSDLAWRLFCSFDHGHAAARRRENYGLLASMLENPAASRERGPLCYPLTSQPEDFHRVRNSLIARGVFVPQYWPDLAGGADRLSRSVIPIPVDHRYGPGEMETMAGEVMQVIQGRRT